MVKVSAGVFHAICTCTYELHVPVTEHSSRALRTLGKHMKPVAYAYYRFSAFGGNSTTLLPGKTGAMRRSKGSRHRETPGNNAVEDPGCSLYARCIRRPVPSRPYGMVAVNIAIGTPGKPPLRTSWLYLRNFVRIISILRLPADMHIFSTFSRAPLPDPQLNLYRFSHADVLYAVGIHGQKRPFCRVSRGSAMLS